MNAAATLSGLLPEIGLAIILWARSAPGDRAVRLMLLFAATSLALGIFERLGTGVSVNAHFDSAIGLMVCAGVALGRTGILAERERRRLAVLALAPLLIATLILFPKTIGRFIALRGSEAAWNQAVTMIRAAPGPVACEIPALCYWSGRPFLLDFYNYGQKLRTVGDPAHLDEAIRRRTFALMIVVRDERFRGGDGRLPRRYNRAIAASYHPVLALPRNALVLLPDAERS